MSGKSVESGQASGKAMPLQGTGEADPGGVQPCSPKPKHWIGLKIVDEDGAKVADLVVHCHMDDGTSFSVDLSTAVLAVDGTYKTEKVLDAANCDFSFPSLFNVEWWPQGGAAGPAASVTAAPAAAAGDCLLSIADSLKLRNYHSAWDQAQNDPFKVDRPNPNMLATGDILNAPDKKDKVEKKAVDQTWTFVVKSKKPFKLRMLLIDKDDKALNGKKWELKTPVSQKGTTGADGMIEITGLTPGDKAGTLEVAMKDAIVPPAAIAGAAAVSPPPYPPVIAAADYKDKMPALDLTAKIAQWDLSVGGLPPVKGKVGTLARLHNLGFGCDVDSDDPKVAKAVKAYQRFYLKNLTGSGITADIQDDAAKRHET